MHGVRAVGADTVRGSRVRPQPRTRARSRCAFYTGDQLDLALGRRLRRSRGGLEGRRAARGTGGRASSAAGRNRREPVPGLTRSLLRRDLRDLVSLDAEPGHQSLLAEDEGVNVVLHRGGRPRLVFPSSSRTTLGPTPTSKPLALRKSSSAFAFMKNIAYPYCWPPACSPKDAPVVLS